MSTPQFVSVEEARAAILESLTPLGAQRCLISEASGRRLTESVLAPFDAPAFDNSAMDGFAFAFADAGEPLEIIGVSAAGAPFDAEVPRGAAVRIMTGAAVPRGSDTVAMQEICEVDGSTLTVSWADVEGVGQHIRTRATYLRKGKAAMAAGALLHPADIGILASFGRTVVSVVRPARVVILTTGTELVEPDQTPGPGQIYNSNAYMLEALVTSMGASAHVVPIVRDDLEATRTSIADAAASADLLLTVGGVSVGDYDFVRTVLEELTGGTTFWKVRMKPGKPLAFGTIAPRDIGVIGLPGNPVSSFVGFHQFVRPAIDRLHGASVNAASLRRVQLASEIAIESTPRRREYVIGHVDGVHFCPHKNLSSGNVASLHQCDAFAVIEEGQSGVSAGELVDVELL